MNQTAINETVQQVAQHDPTITGLAWVVGVVAMIIAIGKPIRDYIRQERRHHKDDRVVDARSSAEATLYNHLSEQVKEYRGIADSAFRERNDLVTRVAALEARAEDLEGARELIGKLKSKLESKDQYLEKLLAQAAEERTKFLTILQAKEQELMRKDERIESLEVMHKKLTGKLASNEGVLFCPECPAKDRMQPQPCTPCSEEVEDERNE